MKSNLASTFARLLALLVTAGCLATPGFAASILFAVQSTSATPGSIGDSFDVFLTNSGASAVNIESFTLGITTSDTDITFEDSTTSTANPYIFGSDSVAVMLLSGVNSTSSPGQTLQASDLTLSGSNVSVAGGATVGLAHVIFDVSSGAKLGSATVSFSAAPGANSLSDASATQVPINSFVSGTINVVPEPSSLIPVFAALIGIFVNRRRRTEFPVGGSDHLT